MVTQRKWRCQLWTVDRQVQLFFVLHWFYVRSQFSLFSCLQAGVSTLVIICWNKRHTNNHALCGKFPIYCKLKQKKSNHICVTHHGQYPDWAETFCFVSTIFICILVTQHIGKATGSVTKAEDTFYGCQL